MKRLFAICVLVCGLFISTNSNAFGTEPIVTIQSATVVMDSVQESNVYAVSSVAETYSVEPEHKNGFLCKITVLVVILLLTFVILLVIFE